MRPRLALFGTRSAWKRAFVGLFFVGLTLVAAGGVARADHEISFRWGDAVRCGPGGTLRFDGGAELFLFEPEMGRFEFVGAATEQSRRVEDYVITLTFLDFDDRVLFRIASEPFEMDDGRRSRILVFGRDSAITRYWDDIAAVDLDAQVPGEPLFEASFDYYDHLVRYFREQELEGQVF
jgi:hypothetical protein